MRKVIISTMHRGYNYGSALQVFALQKAIENVGFAVRYWITFPYDAISKRT